MWLRPSLRRRFLKQRCQERSDAVFAFSSLLIFNLYDGFLGQSSPNQIRESRLLLMNPALEVEVWLRFLSFAKMLVVKTRLLHLAWLTELCHGRRRPGGYARRGTTPVQQRRVSLSPTTKNVNRSTRSAYELATMGCRLFYSPFCGRGRVRGRGVSEGQGEGGGANSRERSIPAGSKRVEYDLQQPRHTTRRQARGARGARGSEGREAMREKRRQNNSPPYKRRQCLLYAVGHDVLGQYLGSTSTTVVLVLRR